MDQLIIELLKYGVVGLVAAIFFKLYMDERKAHDVTRGQLIESIHARLTDQKENDAKIIEPMQTISQVFKDLGGKIVTGKERY